MPYQSIPNQPYTRLESVIILLAHYTQKIKQICACMSPLFLSTELILNKIDHLAEEKVPFRCGYLHRRDL